MIINWYQNLDRPDHFSVEAAGRTKARAVTAI
jgi:hypothetical protein